ncbi:Hypothetical predicted protein, partial [Paramuricea clavata]
NLQCLSRTTTLNCCFPCLQPTVFDSIKLPMAVITDINKIQSGYTDLSRCEDKPFLTFRFSSLFHASLRFPRRSAFLSFPCRSSFGSISFQLVFDTRKKQNIFMKCLSVKVVIRHTTTNFKFDQSVFAIHVTGGGGISTLARRFAPPARGKLFKREIRNLDLETLMASHDDFVLYCYHFSDTSIKLLLLLLFLLFLLLFLTQLKFSLDIALFRMKLTKHFPVIFGKCAKIARAAGASAIWHLFQTSRVYLFIICITKSLSFKFNCILSRLFNSFTYIVTFRCIPPFSSFLFPELMNKTSQNENYNWINNECSFVSLRDVERAMKVIIWFHSNSELINWVIGDEDNESSEESSEDESDENNDDVKQVEQPLSQLVRAVILGIGVCYYARLNKREAYCDYICRYFDNSCPLPGGGRRMQNEIIRCQRGFLKDIQLGRNIARNTALSENVFMMAVCTELRIPLFVVGKPGSSKSLAKDVISSNMKAGNSQSELFKNLKQIHMQSYQCSPLSTPEGIVSTFRQCAKLQKDKDLKKFVSVVVLDEIGLAEDSPLMPLKTLHPLLEDGTATAEESGKTSDHHRVGFIGLSNWALDPAKMNRGIMLSRGVPSESELRDSASVTRLFQQSFPKFCSNFTKLRKILPIVDFPNNHNNAKKLIKTNVIKVEKLCTKNSVHHFERVISIDLKIARIRRTSACLSKFHEKPCMLLLINNLNKN